MKIIKRFYSYGNLDHVKIIDSTYLNVIAGLTGIVAHINFVDAGRIQKIGHGYVKRRLPFFSRCPVGLFFGRVGQNGFRKGRLPENVTGVAGALRWTPVPSLTELLMPRFFRRGYGIQSGCPAFR